MWYSIENLQNAKNLIKEYEQLHQTDFENVGKDISVKRERGRPRKDPVQEKLMIISKCRERPLKGATGAIARFAEIFKKKTN
jgi:hypothetical protein